MTEVSGPDIRLATTSAEAGAAEPRHPEYQLFNSLIFKVNRLASLYFKSSSRYYLRQFGMGVPEVRLLNLLGGMPWAGAQEVVEISSMDKGLVSRVLSNLIRRGYLARLQDPDDRRRYSLKLTPAGTEIYGRIIAAKRARHIRAMAGMTPEETRTLYRLLDKAIATAGAMVEADGEIEPVPARSGGYEHSWPATELLDHIR
jgi:DNA-binding MarR family transcriptional regulator